MKRGLLSSIAKPRAMLTTATSRQGLGLPAGKREFEYVHFCSANHEPKVLEEPADLVSTSRLIHQHRKCRRTSMGFQFAAAREAVVRKARMRSASAPVCIVGAVASPLALSTSDVCVRLLCPMTKVA